MNQQGPLRWIEGAGWLIFGGAANSEIRAEALTRARPDGFVAYVSFSHDRGDALMDDMEDLGAPAGYLVDFVADQGVGLQKQLEEASLVVLEVGSSLDTLMETLNDMTVTALRQVYERGAVILVEGLAINGFGRWWISDSGEMYEGLDWIGQAFLEPSVTSANESHAVQEVLAAFPDAVALEIGDSSALALSGNGKVEVWGDQQVTVSLGRQYTEQGE